MIKHIIVISLAFLLAACPSTSRFRAADLTVTGEPMPWVLGTLSTPGGKGPFPAVVLLHTSGGVTKSLTNWANFLNRQGYATLIVDTAEARGGRGQFWPFDQVEDAYGALDHLAAQKNIDPDRIAVMGFSTGGNAVNNLFAGAFRSAGGRQFKAAISMYGQCNISFNLKNAIPLSFIIGDKEAKSRLVGCDSVPADTMVDLHILKGAYHAFDNDRYTTIGIDPAGNEMLYDMAAHTASEEIVTKFLKRHLGG